METALPVIGVLVLKFVSLSSIMFLTRAVVAFCLP